MGYCTLLMLVRIVIYGLWFQWLKKLMEETHAGSLAGHFTAFEASTTPYLGCVGGKECTVVCTNSAAVA